MIDRNVTNIVSNGGTCFVCEGATRSGEFVIQVSLSAKVKDPIFGASLGSVELKEQMHVRCGVNLRAILDRRIKEATGDASDQKGRKGR